MAAGTNRKRGAAPAAPVPAHLVHLDERLTEDVTTRVSPTTKRRLADLAASEDRSESWLVRRALEEYLDRKEVA